MRAAVLRDGRLEVRETPDPVPGPGELLVRTVSTAICASDIHYMDHPDPTDTSGLFVWDADRDVVMGHEFVGEVVGHGPGCSDQFPVGIRVTSVPTLVRHGGMQVIGQHPDAPGSFGELFLVSEVVARAVPDDADPDAVALTDAFAVGEGYVAMSNVVPGQIPLVIGAGAIGLSAVAALAARGIDPIIIADFNDERLELARRFGAHITVNASQRSPHDVWNEVAAERSVTTPPPIYRSVFGCFFRDEHGIRSLAEVGEDNITFETDYPHTDSTWPDTKEIAGEMFAGLDDAVVRKFVRGNAIRMLQLDLAV
jgi:threonine dehydrogenase-like Zn-dependent dehydrogenase